MLPGGDECCHRPRLAMAPTCAVRRPLVRRQEPVTPDITGVPVGVPFCHESPRVQRAALCEKRAWRRPAGIGT